MSRGEYCDYVHTASEINQAVGARIRLIRTVRRESQQAIGRLLDLSFQQIQKYETGRNRVSADKLYRLAQYFDVEITYFYEDLKPVHKFENTDHQLRVEIAKLTRTASLDVLQSVRSLLRTNK